MGFIVKKAPYTGDTVKDTIEKIRSAQNTEQKNSSEKRTVSNDASSFSLYKSQSRQRVSHLSKPAGISERNETRIAIMKALLLGEMTQGEALKTLRVDVLGLKQDIFAKLTGVSRKTLSEVENDKGNYTSDIINKVFKPFGLQVGLVPTSRHMLSAMFKE